MNKYLVLFTSITLTGCLNIKGDDVAVIYPSENIANVRQFTDSCPVKVSAVTTVDINELSGWVCLPPEKAAKYRRAYEKDNGCN